ncbi:MAG: carbonate dehydratase [Caldilineaceae bacterium]|nr:carbonate dehydratase [Caldilineaceae bacterium]MBP8108851.1 carbonate dehydratase [Caldilineaceae bacterium]MBP8124415.1 carbonate dehydratase [Caldilineaceae bacterium]MBP9072216.1 carbonate dehydratase [Caldilineaceae bacterium]
MDQLTHLAANNRRWADAIKAQDPGFFERLSHQQAPEYLWIGCADSRVPANQITGLDPGEVFVHRNIANLVVHTDLNLLSVLQYAVEYLKVKHVIVCGHYGCGGVAAAYENKSLGLIDNWLRNIKDTYHRHQDEVEALPNREARVDRLCELNVVAQVSRVAQTAIVQNAWQRGQSLSIHGWIYSIRDGLLQDLQVRISGPEQVDAIYRFAG